VRLIPQTRGGALWRFALAAVTVVLFAATATAVAGLLEFKQLAKLISVTPPLRVPGITQAQAGAPQTLLLIGSDHRAGTPYRTSNTDTMMLVRLNADSSTINVLSVPRDLKVLLPQGGVMAPGKLNSAYSLGGVGLLVHTLKTEVFPGLVINHVIDVNFGGFTALVNAVGCVYVDVDHRYYNLNNGAPGTDYSSIDIQPGYERLCGSDALAFVRFRHTDTDIVRNARQQDFLRWAKSQFSSSTILDQRDRLISIFGAHAQTDGDLHTTDGLLKLFDLVAFSAGHTVKQIPFPAILQNCTGSAPCYVTATSDAEAAAYKAFMTPTIPHPPAHHAGGHGPRHHGPPPPPPPLTTDMADGQAQAQLLSSVNMPVYFPARIAPNSHYCAAGLCTEGPVQNSYPRGYRLMDRNGHWHAAYRLTLVMNPVLGQYYGVEGTTWQDPPILSGPHQTRTVNGKQLQVYFNGAKVTLVAWHAPTGVYWISNTLTDDLSGAQMVAIAASLTRG